jgi:uncharacterized membrane protein YgcG
MKQPGLRRTSWTAFGLVVALSGSVVAAPATPFPAFDGSRVVVAGVADLYTEILEVEISRLERASPQTYYVVVVKTSGRGDWATRDYTDQLWGRWRAEALPEKRALDPQRSVLVVLALQNRQLSVHAGTVLQSDYRLRGQAVDRQLVRPHFIPHARAGDYVTV